jgi:hypothetical protein
MEKEFTNKYGYFSATSMKHTLFKLWYPIVKVGFSKFCEIRPRNIVTAGERDTH